MKDNGEQEKQGAGWWLQIEEKFKVKAKNSTVDEQEGNEPASLLHRSRALKFFFFYSSSNSHSLLLLLFPRSNPLPGFFFSRVPSFITSS